MQKETTSPVPGKCLRLSYMYGGVVTYQPGEELALRILTDFELVLIIEGNVTYSSDEKSFKLAAGDMVLGRPGFSEQYKWDTDSRTRHAYFHFGIEEYPSDWPAPAEWPRVRNNPDQVVIALFRHVMQHIYENPDWPARHPGHRDSQLVETLIDAFLEEHKAEITKFERERPEPVRRVLMWMRQIIDNNPNRAVRLEDLAQQANVSEKHLCRLFNQTLGCSPIRTYTLLKLQLALALLVRTNLSIKELANHCGFDNALYFSRCFSQTFGKSPTATRASIRKGNPPPPNPLPVDMTPRLHW